MPQPKTYCEAINQMKAGEQLLHKIYHDTQYGFPIHDDNELFCRLMLEINQAGLSWNTILNKQENFRKAFHNFEIKKVAAYKEKDIVRLQTITDRFSKIGSEPKLEVKDVVEETKQSYNYLISRFSSQIEFSFKGPTKPHKHSLESDFTQLDDRKPS